MGNTCKGGEYHRAKEYLYAPNTPSHTQTIRVTQGVSVYGTVYDWHKDSDFTLKFTRLGEDSSPNHASAVNVNAFYVSNCRQRQ